MATLHRLVDTSALDLFEESTRNVERAAHLLKQIVADYPENAALAADLKDCEHEGDRITHDIIHRLRSARRPRPPVHPSDGHALATALDDIVDHAEQAADWLGLYRIEGPMDQAVEMADVLVKATAEIAPALRSLRAGDDPAPHLVEINRLENDGDRIQRDAVASLFADGIDPMVVIRWKDIFDCLESAVDSTETVAHVIEGVVIKSRR